MNYRHGFHAGNFADVVKHIVLTRILVHLARKDAPFRVIDTHAGAGRYQLTGDEASRTGEWHDGVERVIDATFSPEVDALIAPWREAVQALNTKGKLSHYPGSPVIAQALCRSQDRMIFCELNPRERKKLETAVEDDHRAKVLSVDGWNALVGYVPPKERRGLVLVDPPFEEPGEFDRLADGLAEAYARWATGTFMLWYPIKDLRAVDAFRRRIAHHGIPKTLRIELDILDLRLGDRLSGTGLIVVNPPFTLVDEIRLVLGALAPLLAQEGPGRARVGWLVPERH